jgi:hypothetical protein
MLTVFFPAIDEGLDRTDEVLGLRDERIAY